MADNVTTTPREDLSGDKMPQAQVRAGADDAVVLLVNTDGRIVEHVAGDLTPYRTGEVQEVRGQSLSLLWPGDVVTAIRDRVRHAVRRRCVSRVDVALREADGQKFHEMTIMAHGRDRALVICRDMTDKTSMDDEIRELAFRDTLTGFPNRAAFLKQLGLALGEAKLGGRALSVLRIRLRGLDDVNRSFGRGAGSDLIRALTERLSEALADKQGPRRHLPARCGVLVARTEGNEFSVLLDGTAASDTLEHFALDAMEQMSRPIKVAGQDVALAPSTGIACFPQNANDMESLIANAGIALNETRNKGSQAIVFFSSTTQLRSLSHIDVSHELRWALDNNQFKVHFQPCYDVTTQRVTSAEALLRWFHPLRGLVPLHEILPIAQVNNLSHELGEWVIENAFREASAVHGADNWHISINLFARQSFAPDLVDRAAAMAAHYKLSPTRIRFEIRAADYHRNQNASEDIVRSMNEAGFQVVLDDVGLDAINLNSLLRSGIRQLKLGRKLVEQLPDNADACRLAAAYVAMTEPLGLQVCATGVENDAQYDCLRSIGCRRMQGFFLCEPLPTAEFSAILNTPSARVA